MSTSFTRWFRRLRTSSRPARRTVTLGIERLEAREVPAVDFTVLTNGVAAHLITLAGSLPQIDTANKLPVTGSTLATLINGHNPIDTLRQDLVSALQSATVANVQSKLANTLMQAGLISSASDVSVTQETDAQNNVVGLVLDLHVKQDAASKPLPDFTTDFGLGLAAVPLLVTSHNDAAVRLGYEYADLKFGVHNTNQFFFDTSKTNELTLSVDARLPNTASSPITGAIGFLPITAIDDPNKPTVFDGTFTVDVNNASMAVKPTLTSNTSAINLKLSSVVQPGLPVVTSDLNVAWDFSGANPLAAMPTQFGNKPTAAFNNFDLVVGPTFSSFAADLLNKAKTLLGPYMPIINALHTQLPVISDAGTAYDLLDNIDPNLAAFVTLAEDVNDLTTKIPQVVQALNAVSVQFGTFDLGGINPDLRDPNAAPNYLGAGTSITNLVANGLGSLSFKNIRDMVLGQITDPQAKSDVAGVLDFFDPNNPNKPINFTLSFPFFDNTASSLTNLALGTGINDLVTFSAAINDVRNFSVDAVTLPVLPVGAAAGFSGSYNIDGFVKIGYDTTGLSEIVKSLFTNPNAGVQTQDLGDGLYIDSTSHFNLTGSLTGSIIALGPFAQFAGGGAVTADVHVSVVDTKVPDAKRYVIQPADNDPGEPLLKTSGGIRGEFSGTLYTEVFVFLGFALIPTDFDTGLETILDLSGGSVANPFDQPPSLHLAHVDPNGTLILHMGPSAGMRGYAPPNPNDPSSYNESFSVVDDTKAGDSGESVLVSAYGFTQRFTGVKSIYANGGQGDDTIFVAAGVTSPAVLIGGDGNDMLTYQGSGTCQIYGDDPQNLNATGDDILAGGKGTSYLYGGPGNDQLTAGSSTSYLHGGAGNDLLFGGPGASYLYGEAGNDKLFGGSGPATLDGGTGNDALKAGAGTDKLLGGLGDDTIEWDIGDGNATVDGGTGKDVLTAFGSSGDDVFTLSKAVTGVTLQVGQSLLTITGTRRIDLEGGAGADKITVNDVTAAGVDEVDVDLLQIQTPDNALDDITVNGSPLGDGFRISSEGVKVGQANRKAPYIGGVTDVAQKDLLIRVANVNDSLAVNGLDSTDHFNVTGETGPTRINGGDGADVFNVSVKQATDFAGPLTLDGGKGPSTLTIDESQAAADVTVDLQSSLVGGTLLPHGVAYFGEGGYTSVKLMTGTGNDTINVRSTQAGAVTTVNTWAGDDIVNVSSDAPLNQGTLAGIAGTLAIDESTGVNTLNVSDKGATTGNAHVIIGTNKIAGLAGPTDAIDLLFAASGGSFGSIAVDGSDSAALAEVFNVAGPAGPLTLRANGGDDRVVVTGLQSKALIDTGAGNDLVEVQVSSSSGYDLTVNGGSQTTSIGDRLIVNDVTGGAVMHDHSQGGGAGSLDVHYLAGKPSNIAYQDIETVTPSVDADHSFVQALYHMTMKRNGTPSEVDAGVMALKGGTTRSQLADNLERSVGARTLVVKSWYMNYFKMAPTPIQLAAALNYFSTHTDEQTLAYVFAHAIQPPQTLAQKQAVVNGVYHVLLKRMPTAKEMLGGVGQLSSKGVYNFVLSLVNGLEYRRIVITGYFSSILRQAQPPTLKQVDAYAGTTDDLESVRVKMEASQTFYDRGY
jgi:hypothetical protein